MEELQKKNNTQLQLSTLSQSITVQSLASNDFEQIEKSVGFSVKDLLDKPPIAMVKKVCEPEKIELFLSIQIGKLINACNIADNLNIQRYQIPLIAGQLIELYPVESIEDFVLCFKRGQTGFYGTIYKLDASVLCGWMKDYLDEKYQLLENQVKKEKDLKIEEQSVNYESFKKRVDKFLEVKKETNFKENEYQRERLKNPYKYYKVHNLEIMAKSQEHANELVQLMIDKGELEIE
jgi:hypothetical protein